jgi:uncharacterized coiled-coil DUF342 family protein
VLRNKSNECEEYADKLRYSEEQMIRKNSEMDQYLNKIRGYEQNLYEANMKINELSGIIQKVTS